MRRFNPLTGVEDATIAMTTNFVFLVICHAGFDHENLLRSGPSVWAIQTGGNAERIDPSTDTVTDTITTLPVTTPMDACSGLDSVWVHYGSTVERIRDPGTGSPTVETITITGGGTSGDYGIVWDGRFIYATALIAGDSVIAKIDPDTNSVADTQIVQATDTDADMRLGWDGVNLWGFRHRTPQPTNDSRIYKISPIDLSVTGEFFRHDPDDGAGVRLFMNPGNWQPTWDGVYMWFQVTSGIAGWDVISNRTASFIPYGDITGLVSGDNSIAQYETGYGQRALALVSGSDDQVFRLKDKRTTPVAPAAAPPVVTNINSTPTTLTDVDQFGAVTVGGAVTVNLPASPSTGRSIIVKDTRGTATVDNITVSGNGNTIDGLATRVIATDYESLRVVYTGTEWSVS